VHHLRLGLVEFGLRFEILSRFDHVLLKLFQLFVQFRDDYLYPLYVRLGLRLLLSGVFEIRVETGYPGYAVQYAAPLEVSHLDYARDVALLHQVVPFRGYSRSCEKVVELRH
jgi:hypothetical protein